MGVEYAANGAWGVLPDGPFFARFLHLLTAELGKTAEPDAPADSAEFEAWELEYGDLTHSDRHERAAEAVLSSHPDLLEELRGQYYAPDDATMIWTGSHHDRPGRCQTRAEQWVLGVGLFALHRPRRCHEVWEAQACYHTWVEAY